MPAYDDKNIFGRILRGELPCTEVWQDEVVLAFMDISPMTAGHVLVLPKAPSRNLLDANPATLEALIVRVQRIAKAAMVGMGSDGVSIQQFNEEAGGQSVFHLHFHVLPRWNGIPLKPPGGSADQTDILVEQSERIRRALV
jgi:histidine triad (HIT) family protein